MANGLIGFMFWKQFHHSKNTKNERPKKKKPLINYLFGKWTELGLFWIPFTILGLLLIYDNFRTKFFLY